MNETPEQAVQRLAERWIAKGYRPRALHEYRSEDGSPLYWRMRLEHPGGEAASDGRKIIRPMKLNGVGYVLGEPSFPDGKPLYNLDRIAADRTAPVWIVEGEKAADALAKLGAVATTSGSADSADRADWNPLRGRVCRIWRDNDEAGAEYGGKVAAILSSLGCDLSTVDVDRLNLPPKGDAWDWAQVHENTTLEDLEALPMLSATVRPEAPAGAFVEVLRGDTITPELVRWAWENWLARGKLNILAGTAGTGKTTLALAFAATITTGGRWPDGTSAQVGNVLIWSAEDDPADTLAPRLIAMGADMSRIHFVDGVREARAMRAFDPASDVRLLAQWVRKCGDVALLIVDPIVSAVASDSHKNGEVRRSLQPLVDLAAEQGCALIGITHYSKGTAGRDPLERVTGSLAFGALARIVLGTAKPTEEGAPRRLVRAKSNIGPDGGGFEYELERIEVPTLRGLFATRVVWGSAVDGTARDLLAAVEDEPDEKGGRGALADAEAFLRDALRNGPVSTKAIKADANGAGHSFATFRRAQKSLGIVPVKRGMKEGWFWQLPTTPPARRCSNSTEDAYTRSVSTFDKREHLREPVLTEKHPAQVEEEF